MARTSKYAIYACLDCGKRVYYKILGWSCSDDPWTGARECDPDLADKPEPPEDEEWDCFCGNNNNEFSDFTEDWEEKGESEVAAHILSKMPKQEYTSYWEYAKDFDELYQEYVETTDPPHHQRWSVGDAAFENGWVDSSRDYDEDSGLSHDLIIIYYPNKVQEVFGDA